MLRKDFDLLRNSRPNVPMYADGRELLVFRTSLQSVSVPKRFFRHAEGCPVGSPWILFSFLGGVVVKVALNEDNGSALVAGAAGQIAE